MIAADGLSRRYGETLAVDEVSFEIGAGEVVGLLGHNGAGKSTIMKVLTGGIEPSAGSALINGTAVEADRRAAQRHIGYLPENCPLYGELRVVEQLRFAARLRGIPARQQAKAITKVLNQTQLMDKAGAPIHTLSRGYRQRTGVAQALLGGPAVLILDEPTNGLDPTQIQNMRELIAELASDTTVLLSTHILSEVQASCDRVLILNQGQLAMDRSLRDAQLPTLLIHTEMHPDRVLLEQHGVDRISEITADGPGHWRRVVLSGPADQWAPRIASALVNKGLGLHQLATDRHELEHLFAEAMQREDAPDA